MSTRTASAVAPYFADVADNPVALSVRVDDYKKALADAPWGVMNQGRMVEGNLRLVDQQKGASGGTMMEFAKAEDDVSTFQRLLGQDTINKALGESQLAGIRAALADQGTISKDITLTSPVSTGMVLYDLKSPAEFLVPVETPIRNRFPRTKGTGTSFRYKQITGMTNAQTTSGAGVLHPGITDATQTNFANPGSANALYFNRPPKITWTGIDVNKAYYQFGLSDEVTWSAYFAGVDFQDPRQLSQSGVLYASMLAEERMAIEGRGPSAGSAGYGGALADPTVTLSQAAAGAGQTAIPGTPTVYVWVAANSGFASGGVSNPTSRIPVAATGTAMVLVAGNVITGTVTATGNQGAVYDVYVGSAAGAANAFYYGTFSGTFVVQGTIPTTGTAANAVVADQSFQANGYDGLLAICTGSTAGYRKFLNGSFSTANPGTEFQTAFGAMYAANLANPDEVFLNSYDRVQLSDLLKIAGTTGLRMVYNAEDKGSKILGDIVGGLQNEHTSKMVNLTVHPYLVQGVAPIVSHQLPFPNSQVPACFEFRNVQDYMGISWPQLQLSYDFSSYWYGTFFCHAPAWQGCITGITKSG
jgi:hypothetical protein